MKIISSEIAMESTRSYIESYQKNIKLDYWIGDQRSTPQDEKPQTLQVDNKDALIVELSNEALSAQQTSRKETTYEPTEKDKLKIQLIEKFIEALTGKKFKINISEIKLDDSHDAVEQQNQAAHTPSGEGWGIEFDYSEKYFEQEVLSFKTEGKILTADRQELSFSLELNMSRSYLEENSLSIRAGDAQKKDPLVVNYNGLSAELTNTRFNFDLDADETMENIYFARPGSGFLAIDLNSDGIINNGGELFGTASGNGFKDLAKYDQDENKWIDENDSVYNKLRLWSRDDSGNESLVTLEQQGIGAIYLGQQSSQFSLKNSQNELLAEISSTGVFLRNDKTMGTVQQVNLTI